MQELERQDVLSLRRAHSFILDDVPGLEEVLVAASSVDDDEPSTSVCVHVADCIDRPVIKLDGVDSGLASVVAVLDARVS